MDVRIDKKTRNVNSKRLHQMVDSFLTDRLERLKFIRSGAAVDSIVYKNITRLCNEFFDELVSRGKVDSYAVIMDERNNTETFLNNGGIVALTVKFKQTNCINITVYHYEAYHDG